MLENQQKEVRQAFETYLQSANKLVPDPEDDKKFFKFVILCHQNKASIESFEIYEILEAKGFDEAMQDHLVGLLEGGRGLLEEYDKVITR
jgi:hypothetical protein